MGAVDLTFSDLGAGGSRVRDGSHLRGALRGLRTGLFTFDRDLALLFASDRAAAILGVADLRVARASTVLAFIEGSTLMDADLVRQVVDACGAAVAGRPPEPLTMTFGSGPSMVVLHVAALGEDSWVASLEDVTVRRAAEADALKLAMCDPLTGLPNRALFKEQVNAALAGLTRRGMGLRASDDPEQPLMALMLIDLDRFKPVNDTLGHAVGDALLRLVGNRLRSILRASDVLARLGGDEFALLLSPGPDRAGLAAMAKRVVDVVGRSYLIDGHLVNVGASVGLALAPEDGVEHDGLLRNADLALYAAKNAGRGTHSFFTPEMDARALRRRELEIDLRKALPLREFELYYQPQVDLESKAVVGFEALLRWNHPTRGLVSPADFIPLAEEIGMIVPMGEWVMRAACRQAARWPDDVSVAVNVSPHQFEDTPRLVQTVAKALEASGLPGRRLEIEITESVLLRDEGAVLTALHALRSMGVRVAMDDFGTGYSSLSQLHSFPFDKIKIDRSFVKDRGDVAGQNAIIRAITALGVSLGMSTIAEGVETAEQLDRVRSEGCTSVQGYLFSRPVPVEQVEAMIAQSVARGAALVCL